MGSRLYRITFLFMAGCLGQALGQAEESQPSVVPTSQAEFERDIYPLMKDICFGCHGNKRAKAELNLEAFGANPDFFKDGRVWERVSEVLRHREMPPENKKHPTEDQRILLTEFIDKELAKFDCSNPNVPVNPGRVTLRRLNRNEYNNTVRDLFGVDYQPAADFPSDEVGYGYDNIGDVLSMSPILMEKYLRAAEEITAQAIRTDIPPYPPEDAIRTKRWGTRSDDGAVRLENDNLWGLFREGSIDIRYPFRTDGEYLLQIDAYATLAGPELPKLQVTLNGEPVKTFEVKITEEKRHNFILKPAGQGEPPHLHCLHEQLREQRFARPGTSWRSQPVCSWYKNDRPAGCAPAEAAGITPARDRPPAECDGDTRCRKGVAEPICGKGVPPPGIGKGNQPAADVRRYVTG